MGKQCNMGILFYVYRSSVKDVFGSFLFLIDCFYIYLYCRKVNAEFNKLVKTVGHRVRSFFFRKMMLNTPTVVNIFEIVWILSYSHL